MAAVWQKSWIIIWDKCIMAQNHSLETLHTTRQDVNGNDKLYGGTILLLFRDFRHCQSFHALLMPMRFIHV